MNRCSVINIKNSPTYKTIRDILADLLGINYKSYQRGVYQNQAMKDKGYVFWFPQISTNEKPITTSGWVNNLEQGNNIIRSYNVNDEKKNKWDPKEEMEDIYRIVFGREKNKPYRFYGIFAAEKKLSTSGSVCCIKVSDSISIVDGLPQKTFSDSLSEKIDDLNWQEEIQQSIIPSPEEDISPMPLPRPDPKTIDNRIVYPRNKEYAISALKRAGYKCENNPDHFVFLRRYQPVPYTEPHHLVPMSYQSQFQVSLDNTANIVSLCSSCHNQVHYGKDADVIIRSLYRSRKEDLQAAGIIISEEELLELYGY